MNIALVVTREGMPLGYEIFPGNRTDVTTVEEIVSGMEARFGKANRVWVMDRGMVSAENLAWLNQTRRRYVIGTPKAELRRWASQIEDKTDWRHIREDVEVRICRGPEGNETFLLCRSAARVEKERAMHERFSNRIEAGLQSMARRIEKSKRRLDPQALERQIGRLLERNARAAARRRDSDRGHDAAIVPQAALQSIRCDEWPISRGIISCAHVHAVERRRTWQTYIQLTEADAAFASQSTSPPPVWHQKAAASSPHPECVLGLRAVKTLQQSIPRRPGNSPRTPSPSSRASGC